MSEKRAPVQGFSAGIPWSMHLRAYDAYCKKWSPQPAMIDLEGRNCRGGFSVGELDEFIPGWREELSELAAARSTISEQEKRIAELEAERMCVGCGSTKTIEQIRAEHPKALACCPERKMLSLKEWRDRSNGFEHALTSERQRREELYEALDSLLGADRELGGRDTPRIRAARSALAKARGEPA